MKLASPAQDLKRQTVKSHEIKTVEHLNSREIVDRHEPNRVSVERGPEGRVIGLAWPYGSGDDSLNGMAKRRGSVWDRVAGYWRFQDESNAIAMLAAIRKRHPRWPVLENSDKDKRKPLAKVQYSCLDLGHGKMACFLPWPLPFSSIITVPIGAECVKLSSHSKRSALMMLLATREEIDDITGGLQQQGASETDALSHRWGLNTDSKIQVKASGWAVQIKCDLSNPRHFLLEPPQQYKWEGQYPYGVKVSIAWRW